MLANQRGNVLDELQIFVFFVYSETPEGRGEFRPRVHDREPDFNADGQTVHHEFGPEGILGIFLRKSGVHHRRLNSSV